MKWIILLTLQRHLSFPRCSQGTFQLWARKYTALSLTLFASKMLENRRDDIPFSSKIHSHPPLLKDGLLASLFFTLKLFSCFFFTCMWQVLKHLPGPIVFSQKNDWTFGRNHNFSRSLQIQVPWENTSPAKTPSTWPYNRHGWLLHRISAEDYGPENMAFCKYFEFLFFFLQLNIDTVNNKRQ